MDVEALGEQGRSSYLELLLCSPSCGEELLPGASLAAAGLLGFGGRAFGLDEADLETASGSQSERSVQQRWQFLGSGGFNSSHFTHHQKS